MITFPPHWQVIDERFLALVHPMSRLQRMADGFTWTEKPVWFGDRDALLFLDILSRRIMQSSETTGGDALPGRKRVY